MRYSPLLLLTALLLPRVATGTDVQGELDGDVTWTAQGNPWIVTGDVVIPEDGSLTVEEGVQVRFSLQDEEDRDTARTALVVEGMLIVAGTAQAPVTFTTLSNSPARGQWEGIQLTDDGIAQLDYANVSYAVVGIRLLVGGAEAALADVTVRHCSSNGLQADNESDLTVVGGSFSSNATHGMQLREGIHAVSGVVLHANSGSGIDARLSEPASTFLGDHLTAVANGGAGVLMRRGADRTVMRLHSSILARNDQGINGQAGALPPETDHNDAWDNRNGGRDWYNGAIEGEASIRSNPLFVDIATEEGLELTHRSPCRGKGRDGSDLGARPWDDAQTVGLVGTLDADLTLAAGGHHVALGDLTVPEGVTLTLAPGASLRFSTSDVMESGVHRTLTELIVLGRLVAAGDDEAGRVELRSASDGPARGHWYGIRFVGGANHVFTRADVRHAYRNVVVEAGQSVLLDHVLLEEASEYALLSDDGGSVEIRDSEVRSVASHGIRLEDGRHRVVRSRVHHVSGAGILAIADLPDTSVVLDHLTVHGNGGNGIQINRNLQGAEIVLRDLAVFANGNYGVYAAAGSVALEHALVWDNRNGSRDLGGTVEHGPRLIVANPLVVDADAADYRLTHRSPARAEAHDGSDLGAVQFDGEQRTRPQMGLLREDLVLTEAGSPWHIEGDLIVPEGVVLTVEPGTTVLFATSDGMEAGVDRGRVELDVRGTLHAGGTEQAPIRFASGHVAPARTHWHSIRLAPTATDPELRFVHISHAQHGLIVETDADFTLSRSTISEVNQRALTLAGTGSYEVRSCELFNGDSYGIVVGDLNLDNVADGGPVRAVVAAPGRSRALRPRPTTTPSPGSTTSPSGATATGSTSRRGRLARPPS